MKLLLTILMLACVFMAQAQYNKTNLQLDSANDWHRYENLQLYAVRANQAFLNRHSNLGRYTTFKDGLAQKKVNVTEYQGGTVNTLYIENVSPDTVIVLAGEVVQGGKQDRVIAQDLLLPPHSGKQDIAVYCVEHGRWQANGDGMSFNGYSFSTHEVRKAAAVDKDQQQVWKKVAETNEKNNAASSTGTLTALNRTAAFTSQLKKYTDYFMRRLVSDVDVIGVVAVTGDRILGCDMFANHDLFNKHYAGLVHTYAGEAITSGAPVTVTYQDVRGYLDSIIADEQRQQQEVEKKGTQLKKGDTKLHISTF